MADGTGIDLVIKADVESAVSGLKKVQAGLAQTAIAAQKTDSAFDKTVKSSNQASSALINLGRVAQDAPFGFLGIANNLNPLLESFQRLKATTGTTSAAFKALGASLLGPGGIGIALSVASSLLVVFGDKIFGSTQKVDDAKEALDAYRSAVKGAFDDAAKEATQVQSLIAVLNSDTASRERKLAAIKELNRIAPENFANLKLEGQTVLGLSEAYTDYIANLRTVIAVKIKQQQLEKITLDILNKEGVTLTTGAKKLFDILDKIDKKRQAGVKDALDPISGKRILELNELYKDQAGLLADIADLQAGVKVPQLKAEKPKVDTKETAESIFKDLQKQLGVLSQRESLFGENLSGEKISASISAINRLFAVGLTADSALVKNIFKATEELEKSLPVRFRTISDKIQDSINDLKLKVTVDPGSLRDVSTTGIFAALKKLDDDAQFDKLNKRIQNTADLLTGTLGPAFDAAFSAIANGENAFEAVGESLKNLVIQIISAAIKAAVFSLIIKSITGGSATFGSIFSGLFGKLSGLPAFASGGIVTGPTVGLIGEAGKEAVIPLDRLNDFLRPVGGPTDVRITGALRGQTIFLQQDRVRRSNNRNK